MRRISKRRQQEIADKLKAEEFELTQNENIIAEESTKLSSTGRTDGSASSAITDPTPLVNSAPMLLFDEEV